MKVNLLKIKRDDRCPMPSSYEKLESVSFFDFVIRNGRAAGESECEGDPRSRRPWNSADSSAVWALRLSQRCLWP